MEATEYCASLQSEVAKWKAKVHDMEEKFDKLPSEEKGRVTPFVKELHTVIEEHTARMEELSRECPVDLGHGKTRKSKPGGLRKLWEGLGDYHFWYRPHL
jgi:hypothetical protein